MRLPSRWLSLALLVSLLPACHAPGSRGDEWIQLFDGESLDDWTVKIRGQEAGVELELLAGAVRR